MGSSVCVCAATVCSDKGAGIDAVSAWATQMGVVCIAGYLVAAVYAWLVDAKALCPLSWIGDKASIVCALFCVEETVEACAFKDNIIAEVRPWYAIQKAICTVA